MIVSEDISDQRKENELLEFSSTHLGQKANNTCLWTMPCGKSLPSH